MAKTSGKRRKTDSKTDRKKGARRTPASAQDVVATIKGTQLYKVLRREGIAKKKAGRIVRAATAPVRVAVDVVEALPSSDGIATAPDALADSPSVPTTTVDSASSSRRAGTTPRNRTSARTVKRTPTRTAPRATGRRTSGTPTKADLMKRAREAGIRGRSGMSKAQLESALEAAPRRS